MKAGDVKCPKCGQGFASLEPSREIGATPTHGSTLTIGLCMKGHEIQVHVVATPNGERVDVRNLGRGE